MFSKTFSFIMVMFAFFAISTASAQDFLTAIATAEFSQAELAVINGYGDDVAIQPGTYEEFVPLPRFQTGQPLFPDSACRNIERIRDKYPVGTKFYGTGAADMESRIQNSEGGYIVNPPLKYSANLGLGDKRMREANRLFSWIEPLGATVVDTEEERGLYIIAVVPPLPPVPAKPDFVKFRDDSVVLHVGETQTVAAKLYLDDGTASEEDVLYRSLSDSVSVDSLTGLVRADSVAGTYQVVAYYVVADTVQFTAQIGTYTYQLDSLAIVELADTATVTVLPMPKQQDKRFNKNLLQQALKYIEVGADAKGVPFVGIRVTVFGDPDSSLFSFFLNAYYGRTQWLGNFSELSQAGVGIRIAPLRNKTDYAFTFGAGLRQSADVLNDPRLPTYLEYSRQFVGFQLTPIGVEIGPFHAWLQLMYGERDKRYGPNLEFANLDKNAIDRSIMFAADPEELYELLKKVYSKFNQIIF